MDNGFQRGCKSRYFKIFLTTLMLLGLASAAYAAAPVVNTTISIEKTGSEPFDIVTWDGTDLATAGLDADEDNNVVRMQDSVTYRVEISVNDAAVDNLIATVSLADGKQKWIEVPTGCKTDPAEVSPISEISADGYTLTCNVGAAIEGTTRVVFPAAKVVSYNEVAGAAVLNDEHTAATVSATAPGAANAATAGPTDLTITAGFKVDTSKTLKVSGLHPTTGEPLYKAPAKVGPAGQAGTLMEYIIRVRYQNGSMLIDSNETDFLIDIGLFDAFTDDNTGNNGALSSGGILYTWDPTKPACSLAGDHGATAAVVCTQNNIAGDFLSPIAGGAGDFTNETDGLNDPNIDIALTDIDVRDPDADGNVVELAINVWFELDSEIQSHQSCDSSTSPTNCLNTVINSVGQRNGVVIEGYNPISTEDAAGNNLLNYNGAGEPFSNEIDYPMFYSVSGTSSAYKTFTGLFPFETNKAPTRDVALGETVPMLIHHYDYRLRDGSKVQSCDKIDTTVFEYQGLRAPGTLFDNRHHAFALAPTQQWNPAATAWGGTEGVKDYEDTESMTIYYSDLPNGTGSLEDQRSQVCEDDLNGDGVVVVDGLDLATGVAPAGGEPNDWVTDANALAGGMASTTKIRHTTVYDSDKITALYPSHIYWGMVAIHSLKVKGDAVAYPPQDYLPNYMTFRFDSFDGVLSAWQGTAETQAPTDPADVSFSLSSSYADRLHLVPSSIAIAKRTEPQGIKVVRAGDLVDFIIEPKVQGAWDPAITTATVADALPSKTTYVAGSEMFSVDGGASWLDFAAYNASSPDVTLTSAANAGPTALTWGFGSVTPDVAGSDQLPLIKYTVEVDAAVTSGTFVNTAILDSAIDNNAGDSPVTAKYSLSAFPEFGVDLVKRNQQDIYQTNEAFEMELIYKNLGGENYGASDFIDILPHNADGAGNSGGLGSPREPATTYSGSYEVTKLTGASGETFSATNADPATIPQDPCHENNQPTAYVPVAGDICYNFYISSNTAGTPPKAANTFAGGAAQGTGTVIWESCTGFGPVVCGALDPADITAIRFEVASLATTPGAQTVKIEMTPTGNVGGVPDLDALTNVTAASTGDIYTNTFGGRVPEISLLVISNDVSVTMVSGSIGDYVWMDQNGDGVQDGGEAPIPNVTLNLLDGAGNPVFVDPATGGIVDSASPGAIAYTTATDSTGAYSFDNLPAGDYKVEVDTTTLPASIEQTFDADGVGTEHISDVTLAPVTDPITGLVTDIEDKDDQDFGYKQNSSVGDTVWIDLDGNGVKDPTEIGIEGATVTLTLPDNTTVTTTTNADGEYLFEGLEPGDYTVAIDITTADEAAIQATYPDVTLDELAAVFDADGGSDESSAVTLGVAEQNLTQDFGYQPSGSIGDTVWVDLNGDGIQDAGEEGIEGATVTLTLPDGSTVETTTDADGNYLFDNLPAGDYTVAVDVSTADAAALAADYPDLTPAGLAAVFDADGGNDSTSDLTLGVGEDNLDQDFGYQPSGSIGDTVWVDINGDGVQDAGEEGIEGVTVTLTLPDGSTVTTTTDTDGQYLFDNLPAGTGYVVTVDTSTADAAALAADYPGLTVAELSAVFDADGGNDETSTLDLAIGENNLDQDFGYQPQGSIGDTIWVDLNGDGVQDAGEEGIEGATVTLTLPNGSTLTTTTDADGKYLFAGLPAGDYTVAVDVSTADAAALAADYPGLTPAGLAAVFDADGGNDSTSTLTLATGEQNLDQDFGYQPQGSIGDTVWVDLNGDGIQDAGEEGIEGATVTLTLPDGSTVETTTDADGNYLFSDLPAGDYTVAVDVSTADAAALAADYPDLTPAGLAAVFDADGGNDSTSALTLALGEDNLDQDFGYHPQGAIGDTVWVDINGDGVQDAGEEGIAGVTVTLTLPDGTTVTTTTDAEGNYLFSDLPPGDYTVAVDVSTADATALAADYPGLTPAGLEAIFDADGGNDSSSTLTLTPGATNLDQDFGFKPLGSIGDTVWVDLNGDGVQDAGEHGIEGATVTLTLPDGSTMTTTTDADGKYLFAGLAPGDYTVTVDVSTADAAALAADHPGFTPDALNAIFDADGGTDSTSALTLAAGENNIDQDFGFTAGGAITGNVSEDTTGDGAADTGIPGVTLELLDTTGNPVINPITGQPFTVVTNSNGDYAFTGVPPGDYRVRQIQPAGYDSVSDVDAGTENMIGDGTPISVVAGETAGANDFVEEAQATIEPTEIPTLSGWMQILLSIMLVMMGLVYSRRRKFNM